jgi:hypothetical protein
MFIFIENKIVAISCFAAISSMIYLVLKAGRETGLTPCVAGKARG